jgi:carboxyl-terminal processing protease
MRNTFFPLLVLLGTLSCLGPTACAKSQPQATQKDVSAASALQPKPAESLIDEKIAGIIQDGHYGKRQLNNQRSEAIFKLYIKGLDPNRSYFTKKDIAHFSKYRDQLDNAIKAGNLQPAFAIYDVYEKRVKQRVAYALDVLKHKPNFSVKERYVFDRSHAPWAANRHVLDRIWRKRIKNDAIGLMLTGKSWKQAAKTLSKRYRTLRHRAVGNIRSANVFNAFMNAYAQAMDPHTDYFSPSESKQFQIQMSLKLTGIGAALQSENEYTKVIQIIPGGPAAQSHKLHRGDRITGVAQGHKRMVDVVGWRLDDVVKLIRGPKGSVVRLRILPSGKPPGSQEKVIRLVRNVVKLKQQEAHKKIITLKRNGKRYKIGVINIPSFYLDYQARIEGKKNYASTTRDARRLLNQLKKQHVAGVVLDLRNNGGGSLQEATDLTGLFVPHGPVVQLRGTKGNITVQKDDESSVAYSGPLAVLVNRFSASASEIFAGAIQDYHRGLIVGQKTYGKGTVQTLINLDRFIDTKTKAGQLKLTIGKFYRVTGSSTQDHGVHPDITMPTPINPHEFGEETDKNALPWDKIGPTDFKPVKDHLKTDIPKLRQKHLDRIKHDPAYALYLKDIHKIKKESGKKSISLVLAKRQAERKKEKKEQLARENLWRKLRGKPPIKSYKALKKKEKQQQQQANEEHNNNLDREAEAAPDVLLKETAQIVLDLSKLQQKRHAGQGVAAKTG